MERWNGMVEWNGGIVEYHAHRAPSVTTYTHHICNQDTEVRPRTMARQASCVSGKEVELKLT